jgi:hypothetical protein
MLYYTENEINSSITKSVYLFIFFVELMSDDLLSLFSIFSNLSNSTVKLLPFNIDKHNFIISYV